MITAGLKPNTKILITGSGGMLGKAIFEYFSPKYQVWATDIDLNESWLDFLDVRDLVIYEDYVKKIKPDYIFHLAANTNLEDCELNRQQAYETNYLALKNAVLLAKKYRAKLVYTSTAGVFDGRKKAYTEKSRPHPLNVYGKSKYLGEVAVKSLLKDYLIIRPGWMMGGGPAKDKKFIAKIIKKIAAGEKELNVVNDKFGTPTYTQDFAKNLELLLTAGERGIFHMVNLGECSRADVARHIIKEMGFAEKIKVNEVNSDYYQEEYFAPRPLSEVLINQKLIDKKLLIMSHWQDALKHYLKAEYADYYYCGFTLKLFKELLDKLKESQFYLKKHFFNPFLFKGKRP